MSHTQPRHLGDLCHEAHFCPPCEDKAGPCADLFEHPICGLVACETEEPTTVEIAGTDIRWTRNREEVQP